MSQQIDNLPKVPQKAPYKVDLEQGKTYWFCSCGLSEKQPFCDGAHKGKGIAPIKFECDTAKAYYLCGCKHSNKGHLCDGSHDKI